ncbi:MAG: SLC13 family permease [Candidatus Bipolaricaulota bacterium]
MTLEILLVLIILVAALVVFALDLFPIDFVAFGLIALLLILGPVLGLAPGDAIAGFSNPATITVLAMFILSGAVYRTGMVNVLAHHVLRLAGESEFRQLLAVFLLAGPIAAFINNTPVVAILIPVVVRMSREHGRSPSKLLIPLSYTAQLAGVVTLIGTSTNILASSLSASAGVGGFGLFEFSAIGLVVFVVGVVYIMLVGRHLVPQRRTEGDVADEYHVREFITEVAVEDDYPYVGCTVAQCDLGRELGIQVVGIIREGRALPFPVESHSLIPGDIMLVQADRERLLRIRDVVRGLNIEPESRLGDHDLKSDESGLLEVVIAPNSDLIGGTLVSTDFRNRYGCTVVAIQKHGEILRQRLANVRLNFGDTLLLQGPRRALELFQRDPGFIVTEAAPQELFRRKKIPVALGILGGVVLFAALGVPILTTAVTGCVLMVLTGCLRPHELHASIRWDVIFLLAGLIPLGMALETTGAAQVLGELAAGVAEFVPPVVMLMLFYLVATALTSVLSNSASVVVLVPVGIATAQGLGLDPRAFVLAIMFAASTSFMTPIGYQTNTMVYGPGGYKFLDFTRVGAPLNLLLTVVTPLLIAALWGL